LELLPLDFKTAEFRATQPAAPAEPPDRAYERQWALTLLDIVLGRLRREYADAAREDLFVGLKETLAGGRSGVPYRELAARMEMSEGAVRVAAHRLRRRYRELTPSSSGPTAQPGRRCNHCGDVLPADAPQGLCPRCACVFRRWGLALSVHIRSDNHSVCPVGNFEFRSGLDRKRSICSAG
jgi:hypothetical protein